MPPKKNKKKKPIVASTRKTRSQVRQKPTTSKKNEDKILKSLKGKPGRKKFGKFHCLNKTQSIDEEDKIQSDTEKNENSEVEEIESKDIDPEEDEDETKEEIDDIISIVDDKSSDELAPETETIPEEDSNVEEIVDSPETIQIIIEDVETVDVDDEVDDKVDAELSEQLVNLEVSKPEKVSERVSELIVSVEEDMDSEMLVEYPPEDITIEENVKLDVNEDKVIEIKDDYDDDEIGSFKKEIEDIGVEKLKISDEDVKEEDVQSKVEAQENVNEGENLFKAELQSAVEMMLEKVEAIEDVKPVVADKIIPSRKSKRISLKAKTKVVETREAKIVESKDAKFTEAKEEDLESIEIKEIEVIPDDDSVKMDEEFESDKIEEEADIKLKKSNKKIKEDEEDNEHLTAKNNKKVKDDEEDNVQVKKTTKKVKEEDVQTPIDTDESNSERSEGKRDVGRPKKKVKKVVPKSENEEKLEVKKKKKTISLKAEPKNKQLKKKLKVVEEINDDNSIRRSNRIKTISSQKKSSKGKGLVKKDVNPDNSDNSNSGNTDEKSSRDSPSFALPHKGDSEQKPVKVKSRWRRSSELEMNTSQTKSAAKDISSLSVVVDEENSKKPIDEEVERRLKQFIHLKENQYLTERISCKEAKKMTCDCFLTKEEIEQGEFGCGEDCLNRLLMIECGNLCTVGDRCTNKKFQKGQSASCEVFRTDKKGLGIRASANIPYGEFILEYVGEVLDPEEFEDRAAEYSKDKNRHYYFMALRADAVIDATQKGNISRFINHSCDPNAETQKWTVNGELRIGFFSKRTILAGEEITFDYQFQRYGKEAQKCFCEAPTCRGWLGEEPDDEDDEEEEEDEEEDEEEEEEEEEEVVKPAVVEPPKIMDGEVKEKLEEEAVVKVVTEEVKVAEEGIEKEVVKEKVVEKKKKEKKQKILRPKRKTRKDIFEDLDLDDEIASLQATGLKNQAHTLKLSRLIVRAKEVAQRMKLLKLLKHGELPCRRLFLDYHGLRLMHGWMTDAQQSAKQDSKMEYLRLEILQTVATLPIPNKTMLQDSKVLSIVEKWAVSDKPQDSPLDSESNSPKDLEMSQAVETKVEEPKHKLVEIKSKHKISPEAKSKEEVKVEEDSEFDIRRSVGMDVTYKQVHKELTAKNIIEELSSIFDDEEGSPSFEDKEVSSVKEISRQAPKQPAYDIVVEILALATKLLEEWSSLKEVFRIPKKERIEQMKEHEREADKRYKALSLEQENVDKNRENRYNRPVQRPREKGENERRKEGRKDDRHNYYSKISKHERRKLFAMKVEHDEEERRRKQQEMWRQHEKHCMMMGTDPRLTAPYDPNRGYQCIWNQQIGQWQNYPLPDHTMHPHIPNPNFPYLPPRSHPNIINPQAMQNLPPTHKLPPPILQIPPPHLQNIYPPGNLSALPHNLSLPNLAVNIPQAMVPPNLTQPNMPPASMGTMPPMPNIPAMPSLPYQEQIEDPSQVKFMGPIPPPVKLPPKWKCVKDKYGRPYYYHVKFRKAQWQPPEFPMEELDDLSETSSSSDTSSLSSDSSSDDSDSDIDDNRLMMEIKNKFKRMEAQKKLELKKDKPFEISILRNIESRSLSEANDSLAQDESMLGESEEKHVEEERISLDKRLIEEFGHSKIVEQPPAKKRRIGLVQEIIISPRNEQDKLQFKEDVKRYRQTKEMLKRQKELIMQQSKKHLKVGMTSSGSSKAVIKLPKKKVTVKTKIKETETTVHSSKKIKENFRMNMAGVMVGFLNSYRKPDCKQGRIANTDDFKHLARKLTHFVMLKELKHCQKIEDLTCTESVKGKAKEFVKKYMAKFGEQYVRPPEDIETYP